MCDTTTNNNNNYKLFKLVFNNKYLFNIIFRYISLLNEQQYITSQSPPSHSPYSSSYFSSIRPSDKPKYKKVVNYEEATFDWIIHNKKYDLLVYKINANTIFNGFTFKNLKKFIKFIENQEKCTTDITNNYYFNKFYKSNYNGLINSDLSCNKTHFKKINLLEFSVYIQNFELLKMFSLDELKRNHENSNSFKCLKKELINNRIEGLLDIAIKYGNLEIIKFLHLEIGLEIKDENKAFHYSLMSENRSNVVLYLIDVLDYKLPISYCGAFDDFFSNLMKLDHQVFKRVYNDYNTPILYNSSNFSNVTNQFNQIFNKYNENPNENQITFSKYLEFIQNSIYISSILSINNEYQQHQKSSTPSSITPSTYMKINSILLKKIRFLINYNQQNQQQPIKENDIINLHILNENDEIIKPNKYSIKISDYYNNLESSDDKNSNNSNNWFSNLFKLKSNNNNTQISINNSNTPCLYSINYSNISKFTNINFENFNLEREIKRIYIFDYLIKLKNLSTVMTNCKFMIIEFIVKYNEYYIINELYSNSIYKKYIDSMTMITLSDYYSHSNLIKSMVNLFYTDIHAEYKKKDQLFDIDINDGDFKNENQIKQYQQQQQQRKKNGNGTSTFSNYHENNNNNNYGGGVVSSNLSTHPLFNQNEINIDQQINYIKTRLLNNVNGPISNFRILKHIFHPINSNQFKIPIHSNQISEILIQYYKKRGQSQLISAHCLTCNFQLFKYYYLNFKQLFKWDWPIIGKQIIINGNLEFIKFIHDNNDIGNFNPSSKNNEFYESLEQQPQQHKNSEFSNYYITNDYQNGNNFNGSNRILKFDNERINAIDYCQTLEVAKYVIEELGGGIENGIYKFSKLSLLITSSLNDWNSNYLFYYVFNCLMKTNTINIKLTFEMLNYYNHSKYIESKVNDGTLDIDKLDVPKKQYIMTPFISLNNKNKSKKELLNDYFKNLKLIDDHDDDQNNNNNNN